MRAMRQRAGLRALVCVAVVLAIALFRFAAPARLRPLATHEAVGKCDVDTPFAERRRGPASPHPPVVVCAHRGWDDRRFAALAKRRPDCEHADSGSYDNRTIVDLMRSLCSTHAVCCFDVDVFLSLDGVAFVGHPTAVAAQLQRRARDCATTAGANTPSGVDAAALNAAALDAVPSIVARLSDVAATVAALQAEQARGCCAVSLEPKPTRPGVAALERLVDAIATAVAAGGGDVAANGSVFRVILDYGMLRTARSNSGIGGASGLDSAAVLSAAAAVAEDRTQPLAERRAASLRWWRAVVRPSLVAQSKDDVGLVNNEQRSHNAPPRPTRFVLSFRDVHLDAALGLAKSLVLPHNAGRLRANGVAQLYSAVAATRNGTADDRGSVRQAVLARGRHMCAHLRQPVAPVWASEAMPSLRFLRLCDAVQRLVCACGARGERPQHCGGTDESSALPLRVWVIDTAADLAEVTSVYGADNVVADRPLALLDVVKRGARTSD